MVNNSKKKPRPSLYRGARGGGFPQAIRNWRKAANILWEEKEEESTQRRRGEEKE